MPVAEFIHLGQGASGYVAPNTHVVEFVVLGSKAGFDVSQTLSIGQLGECHRPKLIKAGKTLDAEVTLIPLHATMKRFQRHEVHDLRKNQLARIHCTPLFRSLREDDRQSNRIQVDDMLKALFSQRT